MRQRGLHENTINLIRDATSEVIKRSRYKGVQRQFLEWCKKNDQDFFTPNPVTVMNFLAANFQSQHWKSTTVDTYKSQLLQLYPGVTVFQQDPEFNNFFKVLKANTIKDNTSITLDLQPILSFLQGLPSNEDMEPVDLTRKLCWLLGVCAFLRPSDIARIDLSLSGEVGSDIRLVIRRPKEKTNGVHTDKVKFLKPHPNIPALCPVLTYQAYVKRLVGKELQHPHDTNPHLKYNPLVRRLQEPDIPIGADRIRNHIKAIMSMLDLPEGATVPKARAVGATQAAMRGASLDDIITHGSWASKAMFQNFYRLSSSTSSNFTKIVLG
ncbi:hypothetical protein BGX27_002257 [Mortierella sp. AM989]|nr:hypothetical protein BGX27_002257 [Mortierella sp. AM989]